MATLSPTSGPSLSLFFLLTASLLAASVYSALEFHVGGSTGWIVPAANETDTYNQWAVRNRFHVGDSVYFKYQNDSVLVVDREDYFSCITTNPLLEFTDGNTTFLFDRYGFFYFISGTPGHCEDGQRLIIRVMVHPEAIAASPGPAPGLQPGGGESSGTESGSGPSGRQEKSGASMKIVAGYSVIMAGLGGVLGAVVLLV